MSNRIQEIREEKGVTLRELGDRIGVSHQTISRWQRAGPPDDARWRQLADALDVSVDELRKKPDEPGPGIHIEEMDRREWIRRVMNSDLSKEARLIASYFVDYSDDRGVVDVTPEDIAGHLDEMTTEDVEEHWNEVVESDFVDLRYYQLVFPEKEEGK